MNSRCRCIEYLIVRPTLRLLEVESAAAATLLVGTGLAETGFGDSPQGTHGYYAVSRAQHRRIWDEYLAFRPDRASLTRALASPVLFLQNPEAELDRNPAYATAIAWLLYESSGLELPAIGAANDLAHIWRTTYHPEDPRPGTITDQSWYEALQNAA